jgi:hypothetical protein
MEEKTLLIQLLLSESILYYGGKALKINEQDLNDLYEDLGEFWHSDKDKIILFEYYNDGSYLCEKRKQVYDYRIRETVDRVYTFVEATDSDASHAYQACMRAYEKIKISDYKRILEEVKQQAKEANTVYQQNVLNMRSQYLAASDWAVLPDVTFKNEGEKEMWFKYRQYLRDMSDHPDWKTNTLKVEFPMGPKEYFIYFPDPETRPEYLSTPDQFESKAVVQAKLKLLRFLEHLGLPSILEAVGNVEDLDYENARKLLDSAMKKIDMTYELPAQNLVPFINTNPNALDAMIEKELSEFQQYHQNTEETPPSE